MRHPRAAALLFAAICILRPAASFAQIYEVRIGVDGLTCNLCAAGLERSLRKLDGVSSELLAAELLANFGMLATDEGSEPA